MEGYLRRTVDSELDQLLTLAPAIALEGPKGVGKTGTAERRADVAYLLEQPDHQGIIAADPTLKGLPTGTILLDEWQRLPQVWDAVRRRVDTAAPPGRFLLTGSATPKEGVDTHTGAGRILTLRMRPMALHERGVTDPTISVAELLSGTAGRLTGTTPFRATDYYAEIEASGFPGIHPTPPRLRRALLQAYVHRIIDRDVPEQGGAIRRPETLRRWLAAYGAASSTTTAYSRLLDATTGGDGAQPAKSTTITYRDLLTQLWLLDPVHGWAPGHGPFTRLQQAPKHQLADPALALRLLNLSGAALGLPRGAHLAGPLLESLATLTVRVAAQAAEAHVGHFRTRNGDREIDLIVEGSDGAILAVEVKHAASVTDKDVRHLLWLRDQLPDTVVDLVITTTGQQAYRRPDGVAVIPLALLGA